MCRVIKWVMDNPNVGLKMHPAVDFDENGRTMWRLSDTSDATWGSNKEDGRSVTGHVLHFMGVTTAWKSKAQSQVCLSSCESEYVAISEVAKEAQFVKQVLEDMRMQVQLPMPIFVDINGAMKTVKNNKGSTGLRHVNVQCHCAREPHKQSVIAMIFTRSDDNKADMMIKNATRQEFEKHSPKWVDEVPDKLLAKAKEKEGCQNACLARTKKKQMKKNRK